MNILIVGYGRMGKEIERILLDRGHQISGRVDPSAKEADVKELNGTVLEKTDLAIEFSLPGGVLQNASVYAESGCPAVVGTTGWDEQKDQIKNLVLRKKSAYLYGSNFSIGAHLLFLLAEKAAELISDLPEYDSMITEYHHKMKKDSPSGTALSLAEKVLRHQGSKTKIVTNRLDRAIEAHEIHVASIRGGALPGTHSLLLDSVADSIEIRHTARNRSGFALGAVMAGEWLVKRKGFFTVDDFIKDIFEKKRGL